MAEYKATDSLSCLSILYQPIIQFNHFYLTFGYFFSPAAVKMASQSYYAPSRNKLPVSTARETCSTCRKKRSEIRDKEITNIRARFADFDRDDRIAGHKTVSY